MFRRPLRLSGPRPGGFTPRPADSGGGGPRSRNFGPDAPPKGKRKSQRKDDGRPRGPIKERPVGRLYDADEDWRSGEEEKEELEIDNIATSKAAGDVDEPDDDVNEPDDDQE